MSKLSDEDKAVLEAYHKQKANKQKASKPGRHIGVGEIAALVIFGGLALMILVFGLSLAGGI